MSAVDWMKWLWKIGFPNSIQHAVVYFVTGAAARMDIAEVVVVRIDEGRIVFFSFCLFYFFIGA